jgi:hypothetical protein
MFFIYYQTVLIPGTLHSWVLILGLAITLPGILRQCADSGYRLPTDYAAIALIGFVITLGFFANAGYSTVSQLQAYLLGLASYLFVRENMPRVDMSFFLALLKWFLVINSVLIILQFLTGDFYPARYLAAGDPPLNLPAGVSDGPTKNGMLQAFALSVLFARFIWSRNGRVLFQSLLLLVGTIALLLSTSRAGIVGFLVAALFCIVFAATRRKKGLAPRERSIMRSYVFPIVLLASFIRLIVMAPQLADVQGYNYIANVIAFKLTQREDDSILERFRQSNTAFDVIHNSPLQLFAVGAGVGAFEKMDGLNVHNSYVEFLFENGLFGFLALAFLVGHVIRRALLRCEIEDVLPLLAGLVSMMAFMAFHDVLRGRTFWLPLAMLASLAYGKTPRLSPATSRRITAAGREPVSWPRPGLASQ